MNAVSRRGLAARFQRRWLVVAATLLVGASSTMAALDLAALWDFADPAASERRFVAAMGGASADERLILQTQIARTHGLRGDFARARELLAAIGPALPAASPEVRVRHALELGRTHASAAHRPEQLTAADRETAREHFTRAAGLAAQARLDGLAIDALHMMVFVETDPARQLEWNRRALAVLERSDQPEARRWEGALRHNLGYALVLQEDHEAAIEQFRLARAAHERAGRTRNVRIADWMVAWTRRLQKRYDEALALQLELERAWERDGQSDPAVWRELEAIYRALGDEARARDYAARQARPAPGGR